jgi:hypothetical protein
MAFIARACPSTNAISSAEQTSASQYPREHALDRHDQILPVRGDDLEERLRRRWHIAMHEHLAGRVQDADVHRLHVEIDSAIVAMLTVVESHAVLLLREFAHLPCVQPTGSR